MNTVTMQVGMLPLFIKFYENGLISFHKAKMFVGCVENPSVGVQAIISEEDIYIGADTVVEYGQAYDHKDMPELLAWLQSYKLEMPQIENQQ